MAPDPHSVLAALHLDPATEVEIEPLGPASERWTLCPPGGPRQAVVLRAYPDSDAGANHAAVVEALARTGFTSMPRPLAVLEDATIEADIRGISALAVLPPAGSLDAAIFALAALHSLDIREGLRWDSSPQDLLPREWPLHRLGFAAHEREAAAPALEAARDAILESPWGFVHGEATAALVLLAPGQAELTSFHAAGFGPQLFDVAAFLLTAVTDPEQRRQLARLYASARGFDPLATVDLLDLASVLWGIQELLVLPRRSIELLGDDAALAALNLAAGRIERALRQSLSAHPTAVAIRNALWRAES